MSGTTLTTFTPGDIVISVYGAASGSGSYTLDQASAITLEELTPAGVLVGSLVLPQATTVVSGTTEYAISGEYGSASEGALALSADGRSMTILGYGVSATAFNAAGATGNSVYGNAALAQSTSTPGGAYTPVARIVADIGANATVDTSTALYNIYSTNNPRSVATVNGSSFYLSGQGVKGSGTQGVFLATDGASTATAIDTSTDTREAEIYNGQLYVSRDSTQSATSGANIASYGATLPTAATAPSVLPGISESVTLTAAQANTVNAGAVGTAVNLSPEGFFFANATTLYVADSGFPKQGGVGDGGLQKWSFNGTAWVLDYTLSAGLNLVPNTAASGTTGLYGITGTVVGGTVQFYVTTSTVGELDQSYLYSIQDTLSATTLPAAESFTELMAAAPDSIIRGVSFAPTSGASAPLAILVPTGSSSGGITVSSGSSLTVQSGGSVSNTTVLSGGSATISGSDVGSIIAHGGSATVLGTASGDQIAGTLLVSAATAVVTSEVVENGGALDLFLKGAAASNTVVTPGGTLAISGNATASNTTVSGGAVVLESPKAVLAGGFVFAGPGLLQDTAIASAGFGDLAVISGFGVGDVVDLTAIGSAGASFATSVVSGNTLATVSSGGVTQSFTFAGSAGASLALGADVNGGAEIVYVPPPTSNITVSAGDAPSGLVVTGGSTLTVNAGGTVIGATISSGGLATVAGVDSGSTILAGGNETLLGSANADQVYGQQLVSANTALVTNETVHGGGVVNEFLKGAILADTTILSGGTLNISGNATASNTVLDAGGLIDFQSPKANLTGTLTFSGGGTLEATGVTSAGFGDLAVISGFASGATIDVTTIAPNGATLSSAVVSGNTVEMVSGGGTTESFIFAGTYTSGYFQLSPDDAGTGVQITAAVACYCAGTLVLTERGEVPVETLAAGDRLVTIAGRMRPVKWVGRRSYAGRFLARNPAVWPVVIRAGALAEGMPKRDLWVSPLHAIYLDGLLIPAQSLINGHSITRARAAAQLAYFHVELDTHDVILAEGAPSETFVNDHSRPIFQNAAEYAERFPGEPEHDALYCAPRVTEGALLEPIWQRIAARGRKTAA